MWREGMQGVSNVWREGMQEVRFTGRISETTVDTRTDS